MPNRTIYIRNKDLDKWADIEDKPGWLHMHLNIPVVNQIVQPILRSPDPKLVMEKMNAVAGLCKHGADAKLCKFAKLGKACK